MASAETGLYQQAETILHRLDPRVKVLSCLVLVVLSFGAAGWMQLLSIITIVALAVWSIKPVSQQVLRLFWLLRWFLLFTFLLHLLLSPGRTLWGLSWLSFDGLLSGAFVCLQMLLAVAASALLGITTTTASLSQAFGWFVRPLLYQTRLSASSPPLLAVALVLAFYLSAASVAISWANPVGIKLAFF